MTTKKIFWSPEEREAILAWGLEHWSEDILNKKPIYQRYIDAQAAVLTPERRRPKDPAAQSQWSRAIQKRLGQEPKQNALTQALQKTTPEPVQVPPVAVALEPEGQKPTVQAETAPVRNAERLLDEVLAYALTRPAFKEGILALVAEHYHIPPAERGQEGEEPSNIVPMLSRRPRLPKVVVVSDLKKRSQIMGIVAKFRGRLNLHFWTTDKSLQELKNSLPMCDMAVLQTNNVSHSASQITKARAPAYITVHGGSDAITKGLEELVPSELRASKP